MVPEPCLNLGLSVVLDIIKKPVKRFLQNGNRKLKTGCKKVKGYYKKKGE